MVTEAGFFEIRSQHSLVRHGNNSVILSREHRPYSRVNLDAASLTGVFRQLPVHSAYSVSILSERTDPGPPESPQSRYLEIS